MKQAKVMGFLQLIGKMHQLAQEEPQSTARKQECLDRLRRITRQKQKCSKTINFIDGEQKNGRNNFQRSRTHAQNECNNFGIYFAEEPIKNRYEEKKSLYDIYRDSLQKKKADYNSLIDNRGQLRRTEDELQRVNELAFPISSGGKLKERRQSYTYKKIVRKKNVSLSNRSISILPQQSQKQPRGQKPKPHQNESFDEGTLNMDEEDELMREKKLNYKPIFRIKRLNLDNCKTESSQGNNQHVRKSDKYYLSRRSVKFNEQLVQNDSKKHTFKEISKSKKQKAKYLLNMNQKFSAWEQEKYEQNQELCKILM